MFDKIYVQHWISLPREVRQHLAKVFGLVPTGIAEVRDQTVISDGFSNEDLRGITADKMTEYVGSPANTETFGRLWEITLSKVNSELHPPVEMKIDPIILPIEIPTANGVLSSTVVGSPEPKPFCDICPSKGVRHKKECPKFIPFPNTMKK